MSRRWAPGITTAQRLTVTFEEREFVFDTDEDRFYVGDGSTLGGLRVALKSEVDSAVAGAISDAMDPVVTAGTTLAAAEVLFGGMISVKDAAYGAVGDDATDDSAAFQAAIDAARATYDSSIAGSEMVWNTRQRGVFIPPGDYFLATGLTQTSGGNVILFAYPNTVRIRLGSGQYFLTVASLQNLYISGINTVGGKGMLKDTTAGVNVAGRRVIEHFKIDAHTECGIGNASTDQPFWRVSDGFIWGATGAEMGISLGGYLDETVIERVDVYDCKYRFVIGPRIGGSVVIRDCAGLNFTGGITSYDFWLKPNNTDASANTSGWGTVIENYKAGNENQATDAVRILCADENTGTGSDRLTYQHSTTPNTTGFISGVSVKGGRFSGVVGLTTPLIRSYVALLPFWSIDGVDFDGGVHTYLCEMLAPVTNENAYFYQTWTVDLPTMQAALRPFSVGLFSEPLGIVDDVWGLMQGDAAARPVANSNDDAAFVSLASSDGAAGLSVGSGASESSVADHYGIGTRASQITFVDVGSSNANVVLGTVTADRISYAVVWLKAHPTQSVARVTVQVLNTNAPTSATALRRPGIVLTSEWRRHVFPFISPDNASQGTWLLAITADDYTVTTGDKALIGPVRVYHAPRPQHDGHIRTLESGAYDGGHIVFGDGTHVWQDAAGSLRRKSSAPSSATDGAYVTPEVIQLCSSAQVPTNTTTFLGANGHQATEAHTYLTTCRAGTITRVFLAGDVPPGVGEDITITVRKNAVDQSMTGSWSGDAAFGVTITTNPVTVGDQDVITLKVVTSDGAAAVRLRGYIRID